MPKRLTLSIFCSNVPQSPLYFKYKLLLVFKDLKEDIHYKYLQFKLLKLELQTSYRPIAYFNYKFVNCLN